VGLPPALWILSKVWDFWQIPAMIQWLGENPQADARPTAIDRAPLTQRVLEHADEPAVQVRAYASDSNAPAAPMLEHPQ
jgi:hypothetical protein